jgi:hypothetical protein
VIRPLPIDALELLLSKDLTSAPASVVLGLNSNVTVNDQPLHVQTEDLGTKHSAIVTHVFSKAGQVVKVVRFDYAKHRDKPNLRSVLSRALQVQHAAVIRDLQQESPEVQAPPLTAPKLPPSSGVPLRRMRALLNAMGRLLFR